MTDTQQNSFTFSRLWGQIPIVARLMLLGLCLISTLVIVEFAKLVSGPVVKDENFYIHFALLFLVPGALLGLIGVSFGYAYYQLCKRHNRKPFWAELQDDKK